MEIGINTVLSLTPDANVSISINNIDAENNKNIEETEPENYDGSDSTYQPSDFSQESSDEEQIDLKSSNFKPLENAFSF